VNSPSHELLVSKAFLDLFFPVKTQVKFEEKTRQEIFKEEKTNGRLTVREKVGQVFCVFSLTLHLLVLSLLSENRSLADNGKEVYR